MAVSTRANGAASRETSHTLGGLKKRAPGQLALLVLMCVCLPASLGAQPIQAVATPAEASAESRREALPQALPEAPWVQGGPVLAPAETAAVRGTVTDVNGGVVGGATIRLENRKMPTSRAATADGNGFFNFGGVTPGVYQITVTAKGFATLVQTGIVVEAGVDQDLARIVLPIASTTTDVQVIYTQHEIAEQQMRAEEKQRMFAVFPNFYSSYVWQAAPLSAGQKIRLSLKAALDPTNYLGAGVQAGFEQWQNTFRGYGQGAAGYGKRYGAAFADGFIGSILGDGLVPSLLHQDPRFFFKADGTVWQRALYAASRSVIRKGDNGRWQPNYSLIVGNLVSGGISNLYYPASNRGVGLTIGNAFLGIGFEGGGDLLREFVVPHFTTGGPMKQKPQAQPQP